MPDLGPDIGPDVGPDIAPVAVPVLAGTSPAATSQILCTVVFTFAGAAQVLPAGVLPTPEPFPDLGPDMGPDVQEVNTGGGQANSNVSNPNVSNPNAGQSVSVQMLDSRGNPLQAYQADLAYELGNGQYGCAYSCPVPFAGTARAILTSGPNVGQTDSQPVNLGAAVDLSGADWTIGPPQATTLNTSANILPAQSDEAVFVQVTDASGNGLDPSGNPVRIAITPGRPQVGDFQPALWVRVPAPLAAAGLYAKLPLSVLDGTALPAGNYRVYVQIDGTTTLRCPGYLSVQD